MAEPGDTVSQRDLSTHPSVAAVLETLAAHHVRTIVRYLPDAVRTARAAAEALHRGVVSISSTLDEVVGADAADGTGRVPRDVP